MSQGKPVGKKQPHYPVEVKQAAVERVRLGESMSRVAAAIGCGRGRIHYWVKQWEEHGGTLPELRPRAERRRSRPPPPPSGGAEREAELERLVGQQQVELDFLREALRLMKQVHRPTAEPDAPSPTSSSRAGRLSRKAG
jgi:transposase-like protein